MTSNKETRSRKAIASSPPKSIQTGVSLFKPSLISQKQKDAKHADPKGKQKSSEKEAEKRVAGESDYLEKETHAMSRLVVKGLKQQSLSSDKITKVQRAHFSGCDPSGWNHFKSKLTSCSKCNRSFFPYRVAAHEKVCNEYRPALQVHSTPVSKAAVRHQRKL